MPVSSGRIGSKTNTESSGPIPTSRTPIDADGDRSDSNVVGPGVILPGESKDAGNHDERDAHSNAKGATVETAVLDDDDADMFVERVDEDRWEEERGDVDAAVEPWAGGEAEAAGEDESDGPRPELSAVGQPCGNEDAGFGFCSDQESDECEGNFRAGLCPGPGRIQCCMSHACIIDNGDEGVCVGRSTWYEYEGTSNAGYCPGSAVIECCTGLDGESNTSEPSE